MRTYFLLLSMVISLFVSFRMLLQTVLLFLVWQDKTRTESYRDFMLNNPMIFKDKVTVKCHCLASELQNEFFCSCFWSCHMSITVE